MLMCRCCGHPVPDSKLGPVCQACIERQSHQAVLAVQKDFLPAVIRGYPCMRKVRRHGKKEWHLEMLGYANQAFCGVCFEKLRGKANWEKKKIEWREVAGEQPNICPDCWKTLEQKVSEITQEANR